MSDRGKVRGSFFWSDGQTVGQGQSQGKFFLVGWSDGGRRKDRSFYLALEPPYFKSGWRAEVGGG